MTQEKIQEIIDEAHKHIQGKMANENVAHPFVVGAQDTIEGTLLMFSPVAGIMLHKDKGYTNGLISLLHLFFEIGRLYGQGEMIGEALRSLEEQGEDS